MSSIEIVAIAISIAGNILMIFGAGCLIHTILYSKANQTPSKIIQPIILIVLGGAIEQAAKLTNESPKILLILMNIFGYSTKDIITIVVIVGIVLFIVLTSLIVLINKAEKKS